MPKFWDVVNETRDMTVPEKVQVFRSALVARHPSLFSSTGLGFQSDAQLNAVIPESLARARDQQASMATTTDLLLAELPYDMSRFAAAFPDFRCDFPIYIVSSLGRLDGAGRRVDGKPALILGVDQIADEHMSSRTLGILVEHELFHRYHYQVAGFSDDNAQREVLWSGLWAEGLATYVSMKLNPPATLQEALIVPRNLVTRAGPLLPQLISELEPKLDAVDPTFFSQLFTYNGANANPPSRVGYLIGALAAEDVSRNRSLSELAHMHPAAVRPALASALAHLARNHERKQPRNPKHEEQ